MDRYAKRRFQARYESIALAIACGRVAADNEKIGEFLRSRTPEGQEPPNIGNLWLDYWDGEPPPPSDLKDVYLKRALTIQRSARDPDQIAHAYQLAALCGSEPALRWLREQRLAPLRISTIWNSDATEIWDLNG